jgi:bacterioferritin-associated ferredoxin
MILCVCQAVTDGEIDSAIRGGARSAAEVARRCGAGGDCGGCLDAIEERIAERGPCGNRCADCPRAFPPAQVMAHTL